MEMKLDAMLPFLTGLAEHNTLDYMHSHKKEYEGAKAQFEALVDALIARITAFDGSVAGLEAKALTTRLNRDTRFSNDKSPYTPAFRAHISSAGRAPIPVGYYLFVSPGASFIGGGLFASMFTDATRLIRQAIDEKGEVFQQFVTDPAFAKEFTIVGDTLKRVPAPYPKDHPMGDYIKRKAWALEAPVADALFADPAALLDRLEALCRLMKPFNGFLNDALKTFVMPARP